MGYISGCSPTAGDDLTHVYQLDEQPKEVKQSEGYKQLQQARTELGKEETRRAEVTVVGPIEDNGRPIYPEDKEAEIVSTHLDSLRVVPRCTAGEWYEFGSVTGGPNDYLVSYGPCMMLVSSAVPILLLATDGRMTLQRLWALYMHQEEQEKRGYVLDGVEYGEIKDSIDQFLRPLPALSGTHEGDVMERVQPWIEKTSTVEEMKDVVVHEGGWWVWMAPNDFPLAKPSSPSSAPSFLDPPTSSPSPPRPSLSSLPFDILLHISSLLPLPSLVSLTSLSRTLRSTLLQTPSNRSRLASAWLRTSGQYWLSYILPPWFDEKEAGVVEEKSVRLAKGKKLEVRELEDGDDWWEYLRRCKANGSMRNRRRVWRAAQSVKKVADEAGV
ncbi:hypothetical protein JCM8547_000229 [Rhodosporidiobolus lusitaniae]